MPDWLKLLWYDTAYWISAAGAGLGFSLRVEGARNVPQSGPVLIVSNHQSFLDPIMAGVAINRRLCFLARRTLFVHPIVGPLISSLNSVAIDQEGFAREGLKTILDQLHAGRAVLVFPEGERSKDGFLHPLRPGIHLLIKRVDMKILPIGIAGAYAAWPRWQKYPIPAPLFMPPWEGTIAISIGQPVDSKHFQDLPREQVLAELFNEMKQVQERAQRLRRK